MQQLPAFRYHPDPLDTGSIVPSDATCRSCGQPRGYVYAPPPAAEEDLQSALCPWCIADGSAARQFDAEFTDPASVGGYGQWDEQVSDEIVEEVSRRTPGFSGWQEEKWWTHCGDAAEFLGPAGRQELESRWPQAIEAVRVEAAYDEEQWQEYFQALDRDHGPTAYVFRCLHCGRFGAYSDIH